METKERNKLICLLLHRWDQILTVSLALCMLAGLIWYTYRAIGERELAARQYLLGIAQQYLFFYERG